MPYQHRIGACAACSRERPLRARSLCSTCYWRNARARTLYMFPLSPSQDHGPDMDPNGLEAGGDHGPGMDPNGFGDEGDDGPGMDPNG